MFGKVEELVIVLIIILVLFGAKKLPELSRGIADSVREVRKGFSDSPKDSPKTAQSSKPKTKS
jgi:sec-independent protein translocase protein TatA